MMELWGAEKNKAHRGLRYQCLQTGIARVHFALPRGEFQTVEVPTYPTDWTPRSPGLDQREANVLIERAGRLGHLQGQMVDRIWYSVDHDWLGSHGETGCASLNSNGGVIAPVAPAATPPRPVPPVPQIPSMTPIVTAEPTSTPSVPPARPVRRSPAPSVSRPVVSAREAVGNRGLFAALGGPRPVNPFTDPTPTTNIPPEPSRPADGAAPSRPSGVEASEASPASHSPAPVTLLRAGAGPEAEVPSDPTSRPLARRERPTASSDSMETPQNTPPSATVQILGSILGGVGRAFEGIAATVTQVYLANLRSQGALEGNEALIALLDRLQPQSTSSASSPSEAVAAMTATLRETSDGEVSRAQGSSRVPRRSTRV